MKSIIHSTFYILTFTLAFACLHANAMPYWAAVETDPYAKGDTSPGESATAGYSGYYCTKETAKDLFGGSDATTINSYLTKSYANFTAAKEASGVTAFDSVAFTDGEYHLLDYVAAGFTSKDYIALVFYSSSAVNGFNVFDAAELTPNSQLLFTKSTGTSGDGWMDAPEQVPEPTSGLLLLLGLAGLALTRRQLIEDRG